MTNTIPDTTSPTIYDEKLLPATDAIGELPANTTPFPSISQTASSTPNNPVTQMQEVFIHTIAHRLRGPLTTVRGAAEILSTSDIEMLPREDLKRFLFIVSDQAQEALDQITLVVDAIDFQTGNLLIYRQPDDLKQVIEEQVQNLLARAAHKKIQLVAEVNKNIPAAISFDRSRIAQILRHCIFNAIKFTNENGTIAIRANATGQQVTISIADTGYGIPQENQKILFQPPSFSSETADKLKGHRVPVSLYLAKGIIEAHDGTIAISSAENQGTTITLSLPIA